MKNIKWGIVSLLVLSIVLNIIQYGDNKENYNALYNSNINQYFMVRELVDDLAKEMRTAGEDADGFKQVDGERIVAQTSAADTYLNRVLVSIGMVNKESRIIFDIVDDVGAVVLGIRCGLKNNSEISPEMVLELSDELELLNREMKVTDFSCGDNPYIVFDEEQLDRINYVLDDINNILQRKFSKVNPKIIVN